MPTTNINPDRIQNINYLANHISQKHNTFTDKPKYALLIGAGCSYSSGVPLGGGIIKLCQQLGFLITETTAGKDVLKEFHKTGDYKKLDQYIINNHQVAYDAYIAVKNKQLADRIKKTKTEETKKLNEFLQGAKWDEYESAIVADAQYGYWQDIYSEDPKERQQLIERLIESKEPGGAYILLAYLVEKGLFSNILTTNFDDFINDALLYYTDVRCRFYADDELSQYISLAGHKPNIVKLHGDYRFANMKNTNDETSRLSGNLEQKMGELLKEFGLVVMGYNGADHSIMNTLRRIKQHSPYSLIWCGMDENNVHWRVAELINNSKNSFFVKMQGFDELMGQLFTEFCRDSKPHNLVQKAEERQQKVSSLLKQFGRELNESAAPDETKKGFNKILSSHELFEQAYNEKDIDKQISLYNQVLEIEPTDAYAYNNRGCCWDTKKEYDKALADYNSAIKLDPGYSLPYNNRGIIWEIKKEYDKAMEDYNSAIKLSPDYANAYNGRGIIWQIKKEYDKALEDYNTAIKIDPGFSNAYNGRGGIWEIKKEYDKALEDYNTAIKLDKGFSHAYNGRGNIWQIKKEYDKALDDYNAAIKLDKELSNAYNGRGIIWEIKKEYDKALEDYNTAIKLEPGFSTAFTNRAGLWKIKKEYKKSLDDYTKSLELNPDVVDAYNNMADMYRQKGDLDIALEKTQAAMQKFPQNPHLHGTLAEIYAQQGNTDAFYQALEKAFMLDCTLNDLDEKAYGSYKKEQRFKELLAKYKKAEG